MIPEYVAYRKSKAAVAVAKLISKVRMFWVSSLVLYRNAREESLMAQYN